MMIALALPPERGGGPGGWKAPGGNPGCPPCGGKPCGGTPCGGGKPCGGMPCCGMPGCGGYPVPGGG
ncbi:hypothetical protein CEQ30_23490 [Nocardia brasiliensis]|nr:hypothetical protein CEQ30_23490 [Nocardia brasiliensis]